MRSSFKWARRNILSSCLLVDKYRTGKCGSSLSGKLALALPGRVTTAKSHCDYDSTSTVWTHGIGFFAVETPLGIDSQRE